MKLFLIAVSFLTRIPVGKSGLPDPSEVARSVKYFGVVGLIVGLFQAFAFSVLSLFLSGLAAACLSVIVSLVVTGAFHLDGLADFADAIAGGSSVEKRTEILKDSRLGTYGVSAVVLGLLLEISLISQLDWVTAFVGLSIAHSVSRTIAVFVSTKTVAPGQGLGFLLGPKSSIVDLLFLFGSSFVVVFIGSVLSLERLDISGGAIVGFLFFVVITSLAVWWIVCLGENKLAGVNGDVLGAVQKVSYLGLLLCWSVIL